MGTEFAGVVEAVGGGVRTLEIGDRVFGYSEGRFGCHAELLTVPADGSIASIPANLTFVEAAQAPKARTCPLDHPQGISSPAGAAHGPSFGPMVVFQAATGLPDSELFALDGECASTLLGLPEL